LTDIRLFAGNALFFKGGHFRLSISRHCEQVGKRHDRTEIQNSRDNGHHDTFRFPRCVQLFHTELDLG
jgi:hypothetical protein